MSFESIFECRVFPMKMQIVVIDSLCKYKFAEVNRLVNYAYDLYYVVSFDPLCLIPLAKRLFARGTPVSKTNFAVNAKMVFQCMFNEGKSSSKSPEICIFTLLFS